MKSVIDPSEYLKKLEAKKAAQPVVKTETQEGFRLGHIYMNAPPNQGTINFIPIPDSNGEYAGFIDKDNKDLCREVKLYDQKADADKWFKILPRDLMGAMSPTQESLYNEVVELHKQVIEKNPTLYGKYRVKGYGFMFGYVISHWDLKQKSVEGNAGKMAFIVFPVRNFSEKLFSQIKQINIQTQNDPSWMGMLFNREPKGRNSYLRVEMKQATMGYDLTTTVVFDTANGPIPKVISDTFEIPNDQLNAVEKTHLDVFMGRQKGETEMFNESVYTYIKTELLKVLGITQAGIPQSVPSENVQTQADTVMNTEAVPVPQMESPQIPGVPTPEVPSIPSVPQAEIPNIPSMPEVPSIPTIPGIPGIPQQG